MTALTLDAIRATIAHESSPCLSIYAPTHEPRSPQDSLRWKARLKEAHAAIAKFDADFDAKSFLRPLESLELESSDESGGAVAVFHSKEFLSTYRLPAPVGEIVMVSRSFHVRPLLSFIGSRQRFYLLNLSHGRVSLFQGGATRLVPVDVPNMPPMSAQMSGAPHRDRHVTPQSGGQHGASVWHGQGGKDERVRDEEELKFVRSIDKALWELLHDDSAPLVIASTEKLFSTFIHHCRYPHVLKQGMHGNFANTPIEELHQKAWPLIAAHTAATEQELVDRYRAPGARERVSEEISTIAAFAIQGRIRDLLVDAKAHAWGQMEKTTGTISTHFGSQSAQDDDVLDGITSAVLLRGGNIHALDSSKMPSRSPIAALLRW